MTARRCLPRTLGLGCEHNHSPQTLLNVSDTQRSLSESCLQWAGVNKAQKTETNAHKGDVSATARLVTTGTDSIQTENWMNTGRDGSSAPINLFVAFWLDIALAFLSVAFIVWFLKLTRQNV